MTTLTSTSLDVPMTTELLSLLSEETRLTGQPPEAVVSEAALNWLRSRCRRRQTDAETTAYAAACAGSESDLDIDLESAGLECLHQVDDENSP